MEVRFKRFDFIHAGENEHFNPEFFHFNRNEFAHATVFLNFNVKI